MPRRIDEPYSRIFFVIWSFVFLITKSLYALPLSWQILNATLVLTLWIAPQRRFLPALVLFSEILAILYVMPWASNFQNLRLVINLIILMHWWLQTERVPFSKPFAFTEEVQLTIGLCVATTYIIAGFHKLNWDFFFANSSCIWELANAQAKKGFLDFPKITVATPFIASIIVTIETLVPLGLFFPRTRLTCLSVLTAFHCFLGYLFATFSWNNLLLLTVLTAQPKRNAAASRISHSWGGLSPVIRAPLIALALGSAFLYRFGDPIGSWRLPVSSTMSYWPLYLLLLASTGVFIKEFWSDSRSGETPMTSMNRLWIAAPPLVFLVGVGLGPYLGFRTISSFAMYSNLRTEVDDGNHFLVSAKALRVFDELDRLQLIPPGFPLPNNLSQFSRRSFLIPEFELGRMILNAPSARISTSSDLRVPSDDLNRAERVYFESSFLKKILFGFRPISQETSVCSW